MPDKFWRESELNIPKTTLGCYAEEPGKWIERLCRANAPSDRKAAGLITIAVPCTRGAKNPMEDIDVVSG